MGNYVRDKHASSAAKRWKTSLAALLSLTLGLSMVGVSPALATPIDPSPVVEETAATRATEDAAVGQPESQDAEESAPATEEKAKTSTPPTEESKTPVVDSTKSGETTAPAETKAPTAKKSARNAVAPQAEGDGMSLSKTLKTAGPIKPGGTVTYDVVVGCTGLTDPCADAILLDLLPAPLVLDKITYIGFEKKATEEISGDKTEVKLTFNEVFPDGNGTGLNDGTDYTVTITAKLPENASPELDGTTLTNKATLTSNAGKVEDEADPVELDIDTAPGAAITKDWSKDTLLEKSGQENALTLGGIKNTSKVGATSLSIIEPSGDTDPFASTAFTGFGEIAYPEGADGLEITYFVGNVEQTAKFTSDPSNPNAPPVLPGGTDLSAITGFEFKFTSSTSTDVKGGIAANGTPGSIVLNTKLRDGAVPAPADNPVKNEVSITAQTPKGDSVPATANDSFVIDGVTYSVDASKSFSPKTVVAGNAADIGEGKNRSTVTIGAKNTSNQALKSLSIKEPAEGTAPFGDGIVFEKFVSGTWPAGATAGEIVIGGIPYLLNNKDGAVEFPDTLPTGVDIKSFEIKFVGEFAPTAAFELKFDVLGTDASVTPYANTILASGDQLVGEGTVTDEANDDITVIEPKEALIGSKDFSPKTIEGIPGDKVTANLNTRVDGGNTNVDVREIIQTDLFTDENQATNDMFPAWKPTTITVENVQGANNVLVEYLNAAGNWVAVKNGVAQTEVLSLEALDARGVRVTYTKTSGTFPHGQNVLSKVNFELTETAVEKFVFSNTLGINNGKPSTGTVTVDKVMKLSSGKAWDKPTIVQKPTDMNPTSVLKLSATNTSTFPVDSLTLVDPKAGGINPFDYVNITGFTAKLSGGVNPATAKLKLTFAGGETEPFTGTAALAPVLPEGRVWADVVGFEFALLSSDEHKVVRDAKFDLTVNTALRDKLRNTETLIDVALVLCRD